jgi:hypothetical protein
LFIIWVLSRLCWRRVGTSGAGVWGIICIGKVLDRCGSVFSNEDWSGSGSVAWLDGADRLRLTGVVEL